MSGTFYLVGTPIGNLRDISYRAIDTLNAVDIIACEDTRHSQILFNEYNIHKKLISYNKNNERASAQGIIKLLQEGKNIALVSDAGMPVISDPGNILVRELIDNNLPYTVIPGANAGLCAMILSGYDASSFTFIGFLNDKAKVKRAQLVQIKSSSVPCILYSSCHNLNADLGVLYDTLGARRVCVVKDITKMFERTTNFVLGEQTFDDPKGEYVIVVDKPDESTPSESIEEMYSSLIAEGMDKKQAMKTVASKFNISKSEVYKKVIDL